MGSANSMTGTVRGIAQRRSSRGPMGELSEVTLEVGLGIPFEGRRRGKREVTFLDVEAWQVTCQDLGVDLPWPTRRANFLIEGLNLKQAIGCTLSVGNARVRIHNETKPCQLMDYLRKGLRRALAPDCRGGVYGQVVDGGLVAIGDSVYLISNDD